MKIIKTANYKKIANDDWDINDPKEREKRCPDCGDLLPCENRNCSSKQHNYPGAGY